MKPPEIVPFWAPFHFGDGLFGPGFDSLVLGVSRLTWGFDSWPTPVVDLTRQDHIVRIPRKSPSKISREVS